MNDWYSPTHMCSFPSSSSKLKNAAEMEYFLFLLSNCHLCECRSLSVSLSLCFSLSPYLSLSACLSLSPYLLLMKCHYFPLDCHYHRISNASPEQHVIKTNCCWRHSYRWRHSNTGASWSTGTYQTFPTLPLSCFLHEILFGFLNLMDFSQNFVFKQLLHLWYDLFTSSVKVVTYLAVLIYLPSLLLSASSPLFSFSLLLSY